MKKAPSLALIGSGKLTDSPVTRLLRRSSFLGPVFSSSYRVASRMVNSLRAGRASKDYADLDDCRLIFISVPDERLKRVLGELTSAGIGWSGKVVMLCSALLGSDELDVLAARGASVGSISPIPGLEDSRFLVEGDRPAIVETRRLMHREHRRIVTVPREHRELYLASQHCTGNLALVLLAAASESLRRAGVSSSESSELLEKQIQKTLRAFLKSGRKGLPETCRFSQHLRALQSIDPELAVYVEESSHGATRYAASLKSPARNQALSRAASATKPGPSR